MAVSSESKPGEMHPIDAAFYKLAIKERDYERIRNTRLERELQDALNGDGIMTSLHDFALGMANLEEAHEELCHVYDRSGFVVVGEAIERLRTTAYMLTGQ